MLERIKSECKSKKISIAELERRSDLTPNSIYRWNENVPSVDKIQKVAKILNVSIDFLING